MRVFWLFVICMAILVGFVVCSVPTGAAARRWDLTQTGFRPISFAVTCGTTATAIRAAAGETYTITDCQNPTSTVVYYGGADVTQANGFPVCSAAGCAVNHEVVAAALTYCRVVSVPTEIRCLAIVE